MGITGCLSYSGYINFFGGWQVLYYVEKYKKQGYDSPE